MPFLAAGWLPIVQWSACRVPDYGEFIRAYVVPKSGVSVKDLRAACREKLAAFKIPREFLLVSELPRSATGKVLRKYLTDSSYFR